MAVSKSSMSCSKSTLCGMASFTWLSPHGFSYPSSRIEKTVVYLSDTGEEKERKLCDPSTSSGKRGSEFRVQAKFPRYRRAAGCVVRFELRCANTHQDTNYAAQEQLQRSHPSSSHLHCDVRTDRGGSN